MKILVISDTHGEIDLAEKALKRHTDIKTVIHLGDYFRDAQRLENIFSDVRFEYIYGNSDFMIGDTPAEKMLEFEGKKIFITHGHRYSVKWDYEKLEKKAVELNVDLLMFGHTHIAELIEKDKYILLNPGSISDPRGEQNESYAVLEFTENKIKVDLVFF